MHTANDIISLLQASDTSDQLSVKTSRISALEEELAGVQKSVTERNERISDLVSYSI